MDTGVLTGVLSCMLLRLSKDTQRSRRRREGVKVGGSRGKTQPYSSSPPPVHHPPIITPGWHPGSLRIVRGPRGATAHRRRANSLSLLRTDVSDVEAAREDCSRARETHPPCSTAWIWRLAARRRRRFARGASHAVKSVRLKRAHRVLTLSLKNLEGKPHFWSNWCEF